MRVDQRRLAQVVGRLEHRGVFRAGQRRQHVGEQLGGVQVLRRLTGEADRAIDVLAFEVDAALCRRHAHLDVGMRGLEAVQARHQPGEREGRDEAQGQHLGAAALLELLQGKAHAVEGVAQVGQQRLGVLGQDQPARQAAEQRHAQPLLQPLHLVADGGRRHRQFVGGGDEALVPGGGLEGTQRVQGQQGARHAKAYTG